MNARPLVSVVVPTFGRERLHPALLAMFRAQTWAPLELVVDDDSPAPSASFARIDDSRVRYMHHAERASIGVKRNRLVSEARGEVIVAFDDDDYYAPHYVETMLAALEESGAAMIKLSGWYAWSVPERSLFYWDTVVQESMHYKVGAGPMSLAPSARIAADAMQKNLDGYGFSYVIRREAFAKVAFPDQNFGEDHVFVASLRRAGQRIATIPDKTRIAVHLMHGRNTSVIFPQYRLPPLAAARLFPGLDAHLSTISGR
jgi:glycosyltransferase involved in cell wall biosynthesis